MKPPESLNPYRSAGVIGRDDIAAATMLVEMACRNGASEPEPLAWLGICLALRTVRDGHTCVDLDNITAWAGEIDPKAADAPPWLTDPEAWTTALENATTLVGTPGDRKPLILDGHRL